MEFAVRTWVSYIRKIGNAVHRIFISLKFVEYKCSAIGKTQTQPLKLGSLVRKANSAIHLIVIFSNFLNMSSNW